MRQVPLHKHTVFSFIQGHFSPQCFAPDTEVRRLVTFIYLVLTYYLVASELG